MKQIVLALTLLVGTAVLAACGKRNASAPAAATTGTNAPVALVDGAPISTQLFDFYARNRAEKPVAELTTEQKQELLDELIQIQITAQSALKNGLEKDPEVAARLELGRLDTLAKAAFQKHLGGQQATEQELRAEYETQVAAQPRLEYRARHILVATEPFAQTLIAQLNKGANFEQLARKESMDPSKAQGGDIGWFSPPQMVPPFVEAVAALKKGEVTQKPVQTQFGWHVIRLDDTREVTPPDFEQVKEGLGRIVQQKKLRAHVEELKKSAKIEKKI